MGSVSFPGERDGRTAKVQQGTSTNFPKNNLPTTSATCPGTQDTAMRFVARYLRSIEAYCKGFVKKAFTSGRTIFGESEPKQRLDE